MTRSWLTKAGLAGVVFNMAAQVRAEEVPVALCVETNVTVFARGESGYHTFRIPSVVATTSGVLLAFCEGRKEHGGDRGAHWTLGGRTLTDQVNECEVVELTGGRLMLNMRNYDKAAKLRQTAVSRDAGKTWQEQRHGGLPLRTRREVTVRIHRVHAGDGRFSRAVVFGEILIPCRASRQGMSSERTVP